MGIIFCSQTGEFHLYNKEISYLMKILRNGQIGQLYFGGRLPRKEDYSYLLENRYRPATSYRYEGEYSFSLEHLKQEYPSYGTTDYRLPAFEILQPDGSRITDFVYVSHRIFPGKPGLPGLPCTYTEKDAEAETLEILLRDEKIQMELLLRYTIFENEAAIARSVLFCNKGTETLRLTSATSLCLDLPDDDYEWIQFSGAWARERYPRKRKLQPGIQSVGSLRGASSHMHNPFVILKRPSADEFQGEAIGFSLIYSGNFLAQAEVDTYKVTRMTLGIHPFHFSWQLSPGEEFQTPEAILVYTKNGLNAMSQTFHRLYRARLARGYWRDKARPVLINNWEATYFDFTEEKLLDIARTAQKAGIELFVLDDGWFSSRRGETSGLGDWWPNQELLPDGIRGLSQKIEAMGMKFGLWFELEMVNKDSRLFREHPDWILHTPGRNVSHGRNQYVLDFSRQEVVDAIYTMTAKILKDSQISYIKWDMNRYITECFSTAYPPQQQGEIFHRYILGLYQLYERLTSAFPHVLFESCASGGGRFDPGMLYYAPQCWTSDDTDAVERMKIQYGTSYCYPLSSMGAHVSISPNHQLFRSTSLKTRADVAYFGTFGYELDLGRLSPEELEQIRAQTAFYKTYRTLFAAGDFYRLQSPFDSNFCAWMVVSQDQRQAVVAYYKILNDVNCEFRRLPLKGLKGSFLYQVSGDTAASGPFYGDELLQIGLITSDPSAGEAHTDCHCTDFWSRLIILNAC